MKKKLLMLALLLLMVGCSQDKITNESSKEINVETKIETQDEAITNINFVTDSINILTEFNNNYVKVLEQTILRLEGKQYSFDNIIENNNDIKSKINSIKVSNVTNEYYKELQSLSSTFDDLLNISMEDDFDYNKYKVIEDIYTNKFNDYQYKMNEIANTIKEENNVKN